MKPIYLAIIACGMFSLNLQSQEISDSKFGKGLINFTAKDSSFSVKFAPRIQFRANTFWYNDGDTFEDPNFNFLIRRARLKFDGWALSPKLRYKIELGLSNRDISGANIYTRDSPRIIMDAVLMWNFYRNFELWVGQTKLPGNIERVISSANLQLIDRSILNANFNIDRDIGFQLRNTSFIGENFVIREKFALSQGEGRNVVAGNIGGLQYTGRLELLPFGLFTKNGEYSEGDLLREEKPKLMLAATYDYNDDAVKTRSNLGSYMILGDGTILKSDIKTIFVDAMFKYKGMSVMAEYADRNAEQPLFPPTREFEFDPGEYVVRTGNAFNIQSSYLFKNNYEITARYSQASFDEETELVDMEEYTLGVSKYIVGHKLKIQGDLNYGTRDSLDDFVSLRLGFDFHF